jgi:hypothetical protein
MIRITGLSMRRSNVFCFLPYRCCGIVYTYCYYGADKEGRISASRSSGSGDRISAFRSRGSGTGSTQPREYS